MSQLNYFYDENKIRYTLAQSNGGKALNWLFLPGGPGGESFYLIDLLKIIDLPGNVWLVDLPGNGNYRPFGEDYDFDHWLALFVPMIKQLPNPVIVGHSFGGMFPLLFNACENHVKGLVIQNAAPKLWLEAAVAYAQQFDLPDLTEEMTAFQQDPNQATFDKALAACVPYYFPPESLEAGRKALLNIPFNYKAGVWWQHYTIAQQFEAKWVPQNVPTMIINATHDAIVPYTLFEEAKAFDRTNVSKHVIQDAGHIPWLEKPDEIRAL